MKYKLEKEYFYNDSKITAIPYEISLPIIAPALFKAQQLFVGTKVFIPYSNSIEIFKKL